jgi:hypothetical protein
MVANPRQIKCPVPRLPAEARRDAAIIVARWAVRALRERRKAAVSRHEPRTPR